jgi:hydroxymethylbilane synthase
MPRGAKIGTSSMRRSSQILAMMPDIKIVPLRGNLETRLKKIETEHLHGVILAAAGMKRMGFAGKISQYLPPETMLPAVGQGALGLQIREGDAELKKILARLNHAPTNEEILAERSFLRALGGGCLLPIAALGRMEGDQLSLEGLVAEPQGTSIIRDKVKDSTRSAEELGEKLAQIILEKGGKKLLELVR